jgi:hypothetical protein
MKLSSLFNTAVFPFAVAALSAIGFPSQAEAIVFSGNFSGSWGEPTPGEINYNPAFSGVGTNTFTWGDPIENESSNKLEFKGSSFSTDDTGALVKIGDLTYGNGTVHYRTSVESVPFKLGLSFNQSTEVEQVLEYRFSLENTINNFVDPEEDADSVSITNNDARNSFTYDGSEYLLDLIFSKDNGKTNFSKFWVQEGIETDAAIFGKITKVSQPKKVPEPGLMSGLSVLGIYLVSRRKAKKAE